MANCDSLRSFSSIRSSRERLSFSIDISVLFKGFGVTAFLLIGLGTIPTEAFGTGFAVIGAEGLFGGFFSFASFAKGPAIFSFSFSIFVLISSFTDLSGLLVLKFSAPSLSLGRTSLSWSRSFFKRALKVSGVNFFCLAFFDVCSIVLKWSASSKFFCCSSLGRKDALLTSVSLCLGLGCAFCIFPVLFICFIVA